MQALAIWGGARNLSVTEVPHYTESMMDERLWVFENRRCINVSVWYSPRSSTFLAVEKAEAEGQGLFHS